MKHFITFYISIILFLASSCEKDVTYSSDKYTCTPSISMVENHPMQQNVTNFLNEMINNQGGVGAVVMIKTSNGVCFGAKGMADIASGAEMQPCNRFRVGSITKTFTAATVLRLYDEGKLNLDDLISTYLKSDLIDKIENADKATIRTLLNHTCRLRNCNGADWMFDAINWSANYETVDERLERIYDKKAPDEMIYANTQYLLLGKIIEEIEKKPVYDVMREKVIKPLNLSNTFLVDQEPANLVQAYMDLYNNGKYVNASDIDKNLFGSDGYCDGALISNAEDLIHFLEELSDTTFLKKETFNEMTDFINDMPENPNNKYHKSMGLGLFYFETPYGKAYGHIGSLSSYNSFMCWFPEKQLYFVCLSNCNTTQDFTIYSPDVFDKFFND